jgi:hypothetical protein
MLVNRFIDLGDITIGDLYKFGIYTGTSRRGRPYINYMFIYSLLKIYNENDLNKDPRFSQWMPAYHFLQLLLFKFESVTSSSNFEIFMAKLDIMKRMFHYYSCELYPDEKKVEDKKIYFSKLFFNAICTNKAGEHFILKSEYFLNEKFKELDEYAITHVFNKFNREDWENFFFGSHVYLNCKNGKGFDSVVFDGNHTITFYQDNQSKNTTLESNSISIDEIQKTCDHCEEVFQDILNNYAFIKYRAFLTEKYTKKKLEEIVDFDNLTWRLVFRSLRPSIPISQLEEIKVKSCTKNNSEMIIEQSEVNNYKKVNLIFIGLDEIEKEFEGAFDLKIKYFRKNNFFIEK